LLDEEKQRLEEQLKAAKARIFELEAQNVKSRAASTQKVHFRFSFVFLNILRNAYSRRKGSEKRSRRL